MNRLVLLIWLIVSGSLWAQEDFEFQTAQPEVAELKSRIEQLTGEVQALSQSLSGNEGIAGRADIPQRASTNGRVATQRSIREKNREIQALQQALSNASQVATERTTEAYQSYLAQQPAAVTPRSDEARSQSAFAQPRAKPNLAAQDW